MSKIRIRTQQCSLVTIQPIKWRSLTITSPLYFMTMRYKIRRSWDCCLLQQLPVPVQEYCNSMVNVYSVLAFKTRLVKRRWKYSIITIKREKNSCFNFWFYTKAIYDFHVYPLVTHDPNMLKKVTGELSWENYSVSSRREMAKFLVETVHTVPGCLLLCAVPDNLGPFHD